MPRQANVHNERPHPNAPAQTEANQLAALHKPAQASTSPRGDFCAKQLSARCTGQTCTVLGRGDYAASGMRKRGLARASPATVLCMRIEAELGPRLRRRKLKHAAETAPALHCAGAIFRCV